MFIDRNSTAHPVDLTNLFADGVHYINTSQWFFAYTAFVNLYRNNKVKSVATLYNMALCHHFAKEYTKATAVLIEALTQIAIPSISHQPNVDLPDELLVHEYESDLYRSALSQTAVELNTIVVKLRIRRLLVDVQLELENWHEVIRLSALPEMNKCKNVQEALAISKSKTNI